MLHTILNKKVMVTTAFGSYVVDTGSVPERIKGFLTAYDDEFIVIDNTIIISKKYVIKIQLI